MADSYVCSKARIKCSCGDKISTLTVYPDRTVGLTGQPQANISDHTPLKNIAPFGKCHTTAYPPTGAATAANHGHLTPMPCVPNTPFPWMNGKDDVLIKGHPALLKSSSCRCIYGGTITITFDGQTDIGPVDLSKEKAETEEQWNEQQEQQEQLTTKEILDGIQLALDAAGFIPGFGAIPDLLNAAISALRGDWQNAGLSLLAAVPGIGDAAAAVKLANKGVKMAKAAKTAEKATKATEKIAATAGKSTDNVISLAEKRAAKSDNVVPLAKYERKVEKQVNGPDKIIVTKRTDTVVDSIYNQRKVEKVYPSAQTGSSTSYGAGHGGGQRSLSNKNREENIIKSLKQKKSQGKISEAENALLNELDPKNSSIF